MSTLLLFAHMIAPWWLIASSNMDKVGFVFRYIFCVCKYFFIMFLYQIHLNFCCVGGNIIHLCMLKTWVGDTSWQQSVGKQVRYVTANVLCVIYLYETQIPFIILLLYILLYYMIILIYRQEFRLYSLSIFNFFSSPCLFAWGKWNVSRVGGSEVTLDLCQSLLKCTPRPG